MTPDADIRARFAPDRATYIREHVLLAALGAVGASGILVAIGNPYPWTGLVGAVLAIAARGVYVASEQLGLVWSLTDTALVAPDGRRLPLTEVAAVRRIFSAVQVVTRSGDKHMLRYLADPAAVRTRIEAAL